MEEAKAAAYYDELTRKGEGAARFKQGLGFSASNSNNDLLSSSKASALPSSSSFLSSFVKASSPSKASELEKQAQLESIQNKLKKKKPSSFEEDESRSRALESDYRKSSPRRRRSLSKERHSRRRSLSRDRERHSRKRSRSRDRYRDRETRRRRSRSSSPRDRRSDKNGSDGREKQKDCKVEGQKSERVDFSKLIAGYDKMSPAERVKAKMKLQLAETVKMDDTKGSGPGWERFEFNKDAPLDDEEIEAAEDDAKLVKHIGQSFRFSAIEARKEEQIKAAHDEAMFGAPVGKLSSTSITDSQVEVESDKVESCESGLATSLLSEKVLAKQQGSWRDRARKV